MADPTTGASASSEPILETKLTEMATHPAQVVDAEKKEETKTESADSVCTKREVLFADVHLVLAGWRGSHRGVIL